MKKIIKIGIIILAFLLIYCVSQEIIINMVEKNIPNEPDNETAGLPSQSEQDSLTTEDKELTPRQALTNFLEADLAGARLGGEIAARAPEAKRYYTLSSGLPTNFVFEGDFLMVVNGYEILEELPSEDENSYSIKIKYYCEEGIASASLGVAGEVQNGRFVVVPCVDFFEKTCPLCFQESATISSIRTFDFIGKSETVAFKLIKDQGRWKIDSPSICPRISEEIFEELLK
jgi:hypothetical protein